MYCPDCKSDNISLYATENDGKTELWRCYDCRHFWEEKEMGDNFPVLNKGENMKFSKGNEVKIKVDTGIFYYGEIIHANNYGNLYKVRYKKGHQYEEDIFKGEQLELIEDKKINYLPIKGHEKYKDMGVVPKTKRNDIANLLIDLWEFMKDKTKETRK